MALTDRDPVVLLAGVEDVVLALPGLETEHLVDEVLGAGVTSLELLLPKSFPLQCQGL